MELQHDVDDAHLQHLQDARRALALPVEASKLHWHPFGVFAIPLSKRRDGAASWSRRLHLWHPQGIPVGEASPYGVHTHSGTARSNVLAGALTHHLYAFERDGDGIWGRTGSEDGMATLVAHLQEPTRAGTTHTLPKDQPHGVSKPPGFAISLFEQLDGPMEQPFTTWRRTDRPEEELVLRSPVALDAVRTEALSIIEQALHAAESTGRT